MASKFHQDMAPKGGYGPLQFARIKSYNALSATKSAVVFAFTTTLGYILARYVFVTRRYNDIEMWDSYISLEPFNKAERDRRTLKWMVRLRDEEEEVMKNVPFWEVGKWYDKPIYHNQANRWLRGNPFEIYAHCGRNAMEKRFMNRLSLFPNHKLNSAKWDRE